MSQISIICPSCQHSFSIDEAQSHQVEERLKQEFRQKMREWQDEKEKSIQITVDEELKKREEELKKKLLGQNEEELKALKEENELQEKALKEARANELEIRKTQNELKEKMENLELEKQRQLDQERQKIKEDAEKKVKDEYQLTLAEQEKTKQDLLKQIDELKQKATQGSQQLQGEMLELELEQMLKTEFPLDDISPVGKGISGADVIQTVRDSRGAICGIIIWESKRTKTFGGDWIDKLKDNMRSAKADLAILVSSCYPNGMNSFGTKDGVYITDFNNSLAIAKIMRLKIIELCYAKQSAEGVNDKKQILWQYLTGNEFRQRVEAIVEAFSLMKQGLEQEKKYYTKKWAQEEKLIDRVVNQTVGMHGDLQGLMGSSLPQIKSLEMDNFELIEETTTTTVTATTTTLFATDVEAAES